MPEHIKRYELYGGDVILTFDEEKHDYYIENSTDLITSTTTVTRVIDKPALVPWAAKMVCKYLYDDDVESGVWVPGRAYTKQQIKAILKAAKNAHRDIAKEAMDVGTMVHDWLEAFAKAAIRGDEFMPRRPDNEEARECCDAFIAWYKEHEVIFLETEKKVYSQTFGYSGTFDLLAIVDGKLSLIDWKSSKAIYPEYFLQLAGYTYAYEEEQAYLVEKGLIDDFDPIEQAIIVQLPKDGSKFDAQSTILMDIHFKVFHACLTISNWQKSIGDFDKYYLGEIEREGTRPVIKAKEFMMQEEDEVSAMFKLLEWENSLSERAEIAKTSIGGVTLIQQQEIRDKYVPRVVSKQQLADEYGTTTYYITKILNAE